ncbi:hypothetical protein AVEN_183717-1 [Araneus ventricosus]|uniref:Uncharacterized protein n=1 Tax=Araneus ventricosus TaxID=182803 RepID=A0A4Y2UYR5_ARAVE|nr:hypothetical protein AVEN_183717-1 [Araneus ventricosus]
MSRSRTNGSKRTDNLSERPDPGRHFLNKSFVRELLCGPSKECVDPRNAVWTLLYSFANYCVDPIILVRELLCGPYYTRSRTTGWTCYTHSRTVRNLLFRHLREKKAFQRQP